MFNAFDVLTDIILRLNPFTGCLNSGTTCGFCAHALAYAWRWSVVVKQTCESRGVLRGNIYERVYKQTSERHEAMYDNPYIIYSIYPVHIYVMKIGFPIRWTVKHLSNKKRVDFFYRFHKLRSYFNNNDKNNVTFKWISKCTRYVL